MGAGLWLDGLTGPARRIWAAALFGLALVSPATAQPVGVLDTVPEGAAVLDIRDEGACLEASLSGERCLPADWLLPANGPMIGFHALRWLFGTVGLRGDEVLVIYDGAKRPGDVGFAVAALAHLAGQAEVAVHRGPGAVSDAGGESRSLSREAVYTAPMRIAEMVVSDVPKGRLSDQLAGFAKTGGVVVFPPRN